MDKLPMPNTMVNEHPSNKDIELGAVYTKPEVVDFMLNLIGYTNDRPLYQQRILEPSFGAGNFLLQIVTRLLDAFEKAGMDNYASLANCIRAVELDNESYAHTQKSISTLLSNRTIPKDIADSLIASWLIQGDFLLEDDLEQFDFVIGNPPYIRQEAIDLDTLQIYRNKYSTMVGRSDIYVPFFEKSLSVLKPNGILSFICSDAWTKNAYGRALRNLIASSYSLDLYIDMYGLPAFAHNVGAYTSITRIRNARFDKTHIVEIESLDSNYLQSISDQLMPEAHLDDCSLRIDTPRTSTPWLLSANEESQIVRELESRFAPIEQAGCKIGIGVATGADSIFIGNIESLDIESSRKVPLATGKDIVDGTFIWSGKAVVNPWDEDGKLIDLDEFPRTKAFLIQHYERLRRRHTAKRNPERLWYKTIDKIDSSLINKEKLLIPDIRSNSQSIAYDTGTIYPHHGIYYITSKSWDLRALQALLRFGLASLFVRTYSTRLGGGYVRFQAQNLRKIHIPEWSSLSPEAKMTLIQSRDNADLLEPSFVADLLQISISQCERMHTLA